MAFVSVYAPLSTIPPLPESKVKVNSPGAIKVPGFSITYMTEKDNSFPGLSVPGPTNPLRVIRFDVESPEHK